MISPLSSFRKRACYGNILDHYNYIGGSNRIIPKGSGEEWDSGGLREIGNVLYDPDDTGKEYKTFYSGYYGAYAENNVYIGYAYSSDEKTWTKAGKVITRALEDPYVIKVGSTCHLFAEDKYELKDGNGYKIRKYHSTNCIDWTDDGDVLTNSLSGWDSWGVASSVVWKEGSTWYMLYEGDNTTWGSAEVGLAISSDGENWTKEESNPVFSADDTDWVGQYGVVPDDILKIGSTYYMFYHGYDGTSFKHGRATSTNLTTWTDSEHSPITNQRDPMVYYDGANSEYVFHYYPTTSGIYRGYPIAIDP